MLVRGHVGHFSLIDQLRNDCFEFLVVSLRSLSSQVIDQQTAGPRCIDVDEELYGVFPSVLIKEQFNVGEAAAREK